MVGYGNRLLKIRLSFRYHQVIIALMKKSLAHLPKDKQTELMLVTEKICDLVPEAEIIFLFGSYARGDWVDGPHVQGRGRLTIRKKSDYDICVVSIIQLFL